YAALAGLQEARDRLHVTTTASITPPNALPVNGATNVIYIVSNASTVKPWDNTTNADGSYKYYFDTELCQENVLGLSHSAGVPCTGTETGYASLSGWYQVSDDSVTGSAPWNTMNLDWKWTRITMKANNMTPYPVDGNSAHTDQACWDGTHQMSAPFGASTGCSPVGGVTSFVMLTTGTGYTSVPTVTITRDPSTTTGSGATGTA